MSLLLLRRHYPELLSNVGFETPGAGGADVFASWTEAAGTGSIARTTTAGEVYAGTAAAKLTAGASDTTYIYQNIVTVPGVTYRLSGQARGDGTNPGRFSLYDNSNSAYIVNRASTGITGSTYAVFSQQFTAPAGCVSVSVMLHAPAAAAAWACFDDVSCKRK